MRSEFQMTIKKIVIVRIQPLTKHDFIRYGGQILKDNGFDVWFYDFSPIAYPQLYQNCTFPDLYRPDNYTLFSNLRETSEAFIKLPPDSFVIMDPQFDNCTFKIYQALSKTKIPYCAVINNSVPLPTEKKNRKYFKIFKKIFSFDFKALSKFIYSPRFAYLLGIRPPDFCIAGSELSLENHRTQFIVGKDTKIIWSHAQDYDVFLQKKSTNEKNAGNYAVFLDPLAPMFQGDTIALGYKVTTTVAKYYPSICKFFDFIEKELDIRIEIAAHPKSNHPPYPDYFGGRRTVRGDTLGMIQNSKFVINHASTAFQFAILVKKPVIFLTTDELENDEFSSCHIKAYSQSIEKNPINIDESFDMDWGKELYVDEKLYEDYKHLYIKKKGTEELNSWGILTNRMKQL
jgi:hypothetical protein